MSRYKITGVIYIHIGMIYKERQTDRVAKRDRQRESKRESERERESV